MQHTANLYFASDTPAVRHRFFLRLCVWIDVHAASRMKSNLAGGGVNSAKVKLLGFWIRRLPTSTPNILLIILRLHTSPHSPFAPPAKGAQSEQQILNHAR